MAAIRPVATKLHCTFHGSAQSPRSPAVLLHGLGSCGEDWLLQIPAVAARRHVITPDLRGHGRSPTMRGWPDVQELSRDVVALLHELKLPPVHLAGLSLGGAVALQVAADHPGSIRSLAVINAAAHFHRQARSMSRGLIRLALVGLGRMDWVGAWVAGGLFPGERQRDLRMAAKKRIERNERRSYLQAIAAVMRFDLRARLGEIQAPALIVAGEGDITVRMADKIALAEGLPHARLVRIPGSGHASPLDAPETLNRLLVDFFEQVESEGEG